MGVRHISCGIWLFIMCLVLAPGLAVNCNLKEFLKCSDVILNIKPRNACSRLQTAMTCFDDVILACGSGDEWSSECPNDSKQESCDLLSAEYTKSMVSARYVTSPCRMYKQMKICHDLNCGAGKNHFWGANPGPGSSCPRNVPRDCINEHPKYDVINKETCIEMAKSKSCYVSHMIRCGGNKLEVLAGDMVVWGYVEMVQQCKRHGHSFTQDGGVCNEVPLDVFIPRQLLDQLNTLYGENLTSVDGEVCSQLHQAGDHLQSYTNQCHQMSTINKHGVSDVMEDLDGPRAQCVAAGFSGVGSQHQCCDVISLMAAIFVLLMGLALT